MIWRGRCVITGKRDDPLFIVGPCSLESREIAMRVADFVSGLSSNSSPLDWIFKGSFLKDNRTSGTSYRGPGMEEGLRILEEISGTFDVPTLTDIHCAHQAASVAEHVDVLQIPAFLCRQTSLLEAAAATGKTVNIKKGQFMNPENMKGSVEKISAAGGSDVWLTERGTFFGYGDLVVDFRSLTLMGEFADRVILDVTHSLQLPGAAGDHSGGCRQYAAPLARAAAAWGIDGLFIEVHPDPSSALSDAATMMDFNEFSRIVTEVLRYWKP